ncbi:MAG: hypothetical protein M1819_004752 [Sarea resinae]|nr:MAG: hypothetical protein M1819_004752 [Sarea resinae]
MPTVKRDQESSMERKDTPPSDALTEENLRRYNASRSLQSSGREVPYARRAVFDEIARFRFEQQYYEDKPQNAQASLEVMMRGDQTERREHVQRNARLDPYTAQLQSVETPLERFNCIDSANEPFSPLARVEARRIGVEPGNMRKADLRIAAARSLAGVWEESSKGAAKGELSFSNETCQDSRTQGNKKGSSRKETTK